MTKISKLIFLLVLLISTLFLFDKILISKKLESVENLKEPEENSNEYDDYSILVTSPLYNAIISLDEKNKDIDIKPIDSQNVEQTQSGKYIKFTNDEINYLKANSSNLVNKFTKSNILDKYNMVSDFLNQYDTNLKESDIINLALFIYQH